MKYDLNRFRIAQESCYSQVLQEIKNGKKVSHWIWFIFPQIAGLGKSEIAKRFEIASIEEAKFYLQDKLLSKRLVELTSILAYEIKGKTAQEIFGFPDYLKFHSSMTLFYSSIKSSKHFLDNVEFSCFEDVIRKYFDGNLDNFTLEIIKSTTLFNN